MEQEVHMVIHLPGFSQQRGPQPGPDPAWARFTRDEDGRGRPYRVSLHSYKPDIAAHRIMGLDVAVRSEAEEVMGRVRNRHNSSVYISSMQHADRKPAS